MQHSPSGQSEGVLRRNPHLTPAVRFHTYHLSGLRVSRVPALPGTDTQKCATGPGESGQATKIRIPNKKFREAVIYVAYICIDVFDVKF